jgi:class 3 adenylate cyclase
MYKLSYDLCDAAVNIASRTGSTSRPGRIQASKDIYSLAKNDFNYKKRNEVKLKGVDYINSYFVE